MAANPAEAARVRQQPTPPKESQRKRTLAAVERIDQLEEGYRQLAVALDRAFTRVDERLAGLFKLTEAVVELVGGDAVDKKMAEIQDRKLAEAEAASKKAIADGLAKGDLLRVDVADDECLLTGREIDKDGNLAQSYVSVRTMSLRPEIAEQIIGKGLPLVAKTATGSTFEFDAIYKVVPKLPEVEEEKSEAPEAPTAPVAPEAAEATQPPAQA